MKIVEVKHPLVKHKLGLMREQDISTKRFRELASEVGSLLTYEATADLETEKVTIEGWNGPVEIDQIKGKKITVVPILRAGLGMMDGVLENVPSARISVVGMYRNEETLEPVPYFQKLVSNIDERMALIVDPMLATGGSVIATIDLLKKAGCSSIKVLVLVAAPEGIAALEKAHPDVLNILLQILDDGRITDAQGRVVNFENTIIIMTSNAGSDRKDGSVGFGKSLSEQTQEKAIKALSEFLRPEFINRVDEVICFNKLTEENFRAIAIIMLRDLKQALSERGLDFTWDESVIDALVKKSYSVTYGARNLRRTIQKELEDPIAQKIIESFVNPLHTLHASADADGAFTVTGA